MGTSQSTLASILLLSCPLTLGRAQTPPLVKPNFANTVRLNAYADNWCLIYVNGKLVAADSIEFLPHNVVSVNILPAYPMTIAVLAKDNADPKTGLEYSTQIGDAGFILKLGDGTVTGSAWKAKQFFRGPINRDTANPRVEYTPIPANWFAPDFDDSKWPPATEYPESRVKPDGDYSSYDFAGAKFIWTDDIDLDNTVILRYHAPKPPNWSKTWNADGELDTANIAADARLAIMPSPLLYAVNADGLAAGYVTRVRSGLAAYEQLAQTVEGITAPIAISLGPPSDQVYLVLYGTNLPPVISASASIGGLAAEVAYAGVPPPANGVAQFNIRLPRALAGRGVADVVVTINGRASNPVSVSIQ